MTVPPPDPVLVERFRRDLDALTGGAPGAIGVAVSGGADSLALLLLASAAFPRRVFAISIDHGLRGAAADECRFVGEVCAGLGVPHDIVPVTVAPRGEGVQAAARDARLKAFGGWCRQRHVAWLLTGHHADDQAETILMRLARGSGVGGLAEMAARMPLPDVERGPVLLRGRETSCERPDTGRLPEQEHGAPRAMLVRPLLRWTRDELADIVRRAGLTPVADPSNADPRFDRTRFRALLAATDLLDPLRLAGAAGHCREADDAIDWIVAQLAERIDAGDDGSVRLRIDAWPREVLRRMVLRAFALLGAQPDGPETMRLIGALHAGRSATLAGIKAVPSAAVWTFTRAPPRRQNRA